LLSPLERFLPREPADDAETLLVDSGAFYPSTKCVFLEPLLVTVATISRIAAK